MHQLLGNGWISAAAITHYLTDAARRHLGVADFDSRELTTTIRGGIATGREHPASSATAPHPDPGRSPVPNGTNRSSRTTAPH